ISPGAGSGEAVFTVSANRDGKTEYLSYLFSFGDSRNMPISISTLTKKERKAIDEQIAAYTPPARAERFEAGQSNVDFSAQFPEDIEKNYPYTTIGNYSFHMYESGRSFYVYDKVKGSTIKTTLSLPVDFSEAEILFMQSARNGEDLEIFVTASHKTMRYVILRYNISADSQYQYHTEISLVGQSEHDAIYNAKEKYSEEARIFKEKQDDPIPSVLAGTVNMYIDGTSPMLPHWLRDNGFHITKYAITDLDENGTNEAVLSLGMGTNEYYGYLVLHTYKGRVRAELLMYRQFMSLKEDGRFSFSSGVANNGVGRLSFENGKCSTIVLAHQEDKNYFIGASAVSADEYNKYINEHYQSNDVTWYAVDQTGNPVKAVIRSFKYDVERSIKLAVPSEWYREESIPFQIYMNEARPFNFISNDYSYFNDTIGRLLLHDESHVDNSEYDISGVCDAGHEYKGRKEELTGMNRYIFRISAGEVIYYLEIREWTAYDSNNFFEDVVLPIVKSFDVIYDAIYTYGWYAKYESDSDTCFF
ncbi:MAG: hypothetical protein IKM18_02135, partial [Clostridia bacterium]|nr:hypothetical protein [Clostridia bacterium]